MDPEGKDGLHRAGDGDRQDATSTEKVNVPRGGENVKGEAGNNSGATKLDHARVLPLLVRKRQRRTGAGSGVLRHLGGVPDSGVILNTVTHAVHDEIIFVPVGFIRVPIGGDTTRSLLFFGLLHPTTEEVALAFDSTQLGVARGWVAATMNDRLRDPKTGQMATPPMFFKSYRLSVNAGERGQLDWSVRPHELTTKLPDGRALASAAKELAKAVNAEAIQVATADDVLSLWSGRARP